MYVQQKNQFKIYIQLNRHYFRLVKDENHQKQCMAVLLGVYFVNSAGQVENPSWYLFI